MHRNSPEANLEGCGDVCVGHVHGVHLSRSRVHDAMAGVCGLAELEGVLRQAMSTLKGSTGVGGGVGDVGQG